MVLKEKEKNMLTNDQIRHGLESIYYALSVINHESFTAYKFASEFEKDVICGEHHLNGFRLNMRERLRILEGLTQCISRLVEVVMNPEETGSGNEQDCEGKQCVGL